MYVLIINICMLQGSASLLKKLHAVDLKKKPKPKKVMDFRDEGKCSGKYSKTESTEYDFFLLRKI